jgi:hypothetical protein
MIITDKDKPTTTPVPVMDPQQKSCLHCKHHGLKVGSDKTMRSVCRINPPTVLSTFIQQNGGNGLQVVQANVWPEMHRDDWCG